MSLRDGTAPPAVGTRDDAPSGPRWCVGLGLLLLLSACAAPGVHRAEASSLGCMRAMVRDHVPTHLYDKQQHCLAAGFIARYCSRPEAWLASVGKEVTDAFDGGDPSWHDLMADRVGLRCERGADSDAALMACCASAFPSQPPRQP